MEKSPFSQSIHHVDSSNIRFIAIIEVYDADVFEIREKKMRLIAPQYIGGFFLHSVPIDASLEYEQDRS